MIKITIENEDRHVTVTDMNESCESTWPQLVRIFLDALHSLGYQPDDNLADEAESEE